MAWYWWPLLYLAMGVFTLAVDNSDEDYATYWAITMVFWLWPLAWAVALAIGIYWTIGKLKGMFNVRQ